jgi:hypothetical protein
MTIDDETPTLPLDDATVADVLREIERKVLTDIEREAAERGESAATIARLLQNYRQALDQGRARRLAKTKAWMQGEVDRLFGRAAVH